MRARGVGFAACSSSDKLAGCRNDLDTMIRAPVAGIAGNRPGQTMWAGQ